MRKKFNISVASKYLQKVLGTLDFIFVAIYRLLTRQSTNKAVLIELLGGIGDFVLFTASIKGYREIFPDSKMVLLGRSELTTFVQAMFIY